MPFKNNKVGNLDLIVDNYLLIIIKEESNRTNSNYSSIANKH